MSRNNFSPKVKQQARDRAGYVCEIDGCEEYAFEVDHKEECWENEDGGDNSLDNAQVLCQRHHREKTSHSTHLRCKGKRFAVVKGRPKSGKIQSPDFHKPENHKHRWPKRKVGA